MAKYRLVFKASVAKDLRRIPKQDVARVLTKIDALRENPRPIGAEKMSTTARYRVRQGVYRILNEIVDDELVILVVKMGHRRDAYRDSQREK